MKKLLTISVFLVAFASFANTTNPIKKCKFRKNTKKEVKIKNDFKKVTFIKVVKSEKKKEEAAFCKVTKGNTTVRCWFCNCAKLLKSI